MADSLFGVALLVLLFFGLIGAMLTATLAAWFLYQLARGRVRRVKTVNDDGSIDTHLSIGKDA